MAKDKKLFMDYMFRFLEDLGNELGWASTMKRKVIFHDGYNGSGGMLFELNGYLKEDPEHPSTSGYVAINVYPAYPYGVPSERGNQLYDLVLQTYVGSTQHLDSYPTGIENLNFDDFVDDIVDSFS